VNGHPSCDGFDAMLVVSPEHGRVLADAGWDRARACSPSTSRCSCCPPTSWRGRRRTWPRASGRLACGLDLPSSDPGGLLVVHAGGDAGLFQRGRRRVGVG
jgi:hypothetical protein